MVQVLLLSLLQKVSCTPRLHDASVNVTMEAYRPLVASPELHQDWNDPQQERNASWPELFFDLFFVAAISNLSHLFKDYPDAGNAGMIMPHS